MMKSNMQSLFKSERVSIWSELALELRPLMASLINPREMVSTIRSSICMWLSLVEIKEFVL